MSKRVTVNVYDFDTQTEEIRTTWDDGSNIIVKSNAKKLKTKIQVLDCTGDKKESISKKFKLSRLLGSLEAQTFVNEYVTKFDEANQ